MPRKKEHKTNRSLFTAEVVDKKKAVGDVTKYHGLSRANLARHVTAARTAEQRGTSRWRQSTRPGKMV